MKYTNKFGIKSKSMLAALEHDGYDFVPLRNVISCTTSLDAPRPFYLRLRHDENIEVDVSDRLWTLDGSAVHYVLECAHHKSGIGLAEERIYIEISEDAGKEWHAHTLPEGGSVTDQPWYSPDKWYITVKFDSYIEDGHVLEDHKRMQPWELVYGMKPHREQQLNIGCLGMRLLGFSVDLLRVCCWLKNWDRRKAGKDGYPAIGAAEVEFKPWTDLATKSFILSRLKVFKEAMDKPDDLLPVCNAEERWYREGELAIMKNDNVRATRCFPEAERRAAELHMAELQAKSPKDKYRIDFRPGNDVRCKGYCICTKFCNYYQKNHVGSEVVQEELF